MNRYFRNTIQRPISSEPPKPLYGYRASLAASHHIPLKLSGGRGGGTMTFDIQNANSKQTFPVNASQSPSRYIASVYIFQIWKVFKFVVILRNIKHFPCWYTVISTWVEIGKTRNVWKHDARREECFHTISSFSSFHECWYNCISIRKKCFIFLL